MALRVLVFSRITSIMPRATVGLAGCVRGLKIDMQPPKFDEKDIDKLIEKAKAEKTLDWDMFADCVSDAQVKDDILGLKNAVKKAKLDCEVNVKDIDWDYWRSKIRTPGIVDEFEKAHKAIHIPMMEDKYTDKLKEVIAPILEAAKYTATESSSRLKEIEMELAEIEKEMEGITDLTVDDVLKQYPEYVGGGKEATEHVMSERCAELQRMLKKSSKTRRRDGGDSK